MGSLARVPAETFTHTVTVHADETAIEALLQEPATWKGIGPIDEVWDADHDHGRLSGFRWSARAAGKSWEGTAERVGDDQPMTFELDSSEIAGSITVSLEAGADGTAITVELFARSKGLLSGMFWGVVANAMRNGLPGQVEGFAGQFG